MSARKLTVADVCPVGLAIAVLLLAGCTSVPVRPVRLVTAPADAQGCTLLTVLRDDDMDDLRKRAAKQGADTVMVTGSTGVDIPIFSKVKYVANIYQCGKE